MLFSRTLTTWRIFALLSLVAFLLVSSGTNLVLFQQAVSLRADADALRARLKSSQDEKTALEARIAELSAASSGVTAAPVPGLNLPDRVILDTIKQQVATIRGLQPKNEVPVAAMSQAQLRDYLVAELNRSYSAEQRDADQKLLVTLGMLQPSQSYFNYVLDLLQDRVLGFYARTDKKMYLVADQPGFNAATKTTFAHELVHSLQDQQFNLDVLAPVKPENKDRGRAMLAVIEGDATLTQRLWAQNNLSAAEQQELAVNTGPSKVEQAPLFIYTELLFPYTDGFTFVREASQRGGGPASLNSLYADPPESTEQVMHPAKYRAKEKPIEVSLPNIASMAGQGWKQLDSNVLGELFLRVLIKQNGDADRADRGSQGWGGDRWQLLEFEGRQAVVLKTAWDTETDAREFFDAYGVSLQSRFSGAKQEFLSTERLAITAATNAAEMRRRGSEVLVVISFDRPSAQSLAGLAGF